MTAPRPRPALCPALLLLLVGGCTDSPVLTQLEPSESPVASAMGTPAPALLSSVSYAGATVQLWPYTDTNFEATPQDPLNLVFVGHADPRNVRDALLSLSGSRSPAEFPTSPVWPLLSAVAQGCAWTDGVGGHQTTYSDAGGWSGSAIQLECGSFNGVRYHVRLFRAGEWTVANAHVDVLIPGTNQHEVLTWEAAEAFVAMELARGGLLAAPPAASGVINDAPSFGTIRTAVYNALPDGLQILASGAPGDATSPVPVRTDGRATILSLVDAPSAAGTSQVFTVQFGQFIPKPFCAGAGEWIRIDGPLDLRYEVRVSASGELESQMFGDGEFEVRPFNPVTGQLGSLMRAVAREHYVTHITDQFTSVLATRNQRLYPDNAAPQLLREHLQVGPQGLTRHSSDERCRDS